MKRIILVLCVTGIVLICGFADAQGPRFGPAVYRHVPIGLASVFAVDFDCDGDNDLAAASTADSRVYVFRNDGCEIFGPAGDYAVGMYPYSLFAADFNGDTNYDLAVTGAIPRDVSILMNQGDGTFAPAVTYPVGDYPTSVFAADLDGDYNYDLAVANAVLESVSVLINNGDGTFATAINYGVGIYPYSVFAADLDGDIDNDLAVANAYSHDVSILLNNGNGLFLPGINYGAGAYPRSIIATDLDGDGDNDLAVANEGSNDVSVLLNDGYGNFPAFFNYGVGINPQSVSVADFDYDGDADLAVANAGSGDISVLENNGDASFHSAVNYGVDTYPRSVFAADLDGDDDHDLAVANLLNDSLCILYNVSGGLIAGTVTGDMLTPIPGAIVAAAQNSTIVAIDTTDENGKYSIWPGNLLPRIYDVMAGREGFNSVFSDSIQVTCWHTTTLDFQLEAFDVGWEYYARKAPGVLTGWGTINCVPQGEALFNHYIYKHMSYRGAIPHWANDFLLEFRWDRSCGNIDFLKFAVPSYSYANLNGPSGLLSRWTLAPLAQWLQYHLAQPLVLVGVGDSTGSIQHAYVLVNPAEWLADPRPTQETYEIFGGRCNELPGYLIGTTPFVFDSLAGPNENPFSTTPLTGTLFLDAEISLLSYASGSGCPYLPGDINGVPPANGIDVTYAVAYLKGGNPPPVSCDMCPQPLYAAMDVNGSCNTNGIDITYFVSFLKGGPPLRYCPDCPPAR